MQQQGDIMNRVKKPLIIVSVIVIVAMLGIPFLIHLCFSYHAPNDFIKAKWDAGDILQYVGTILSAIIAIIGIGVTIWYTQKQYHDDVKNGVLPYFSVEISSEKPKHINGNDQHHINYVFVIIQDHQYNVKSKMDEELQELLRKAEVYDEGYGASLKIKAPENKILMFDVVNLGNGPAISFTVSCNVKTHEENADYSLPININQSEKIPVCVLVEDYKNTTSIDFNIIYGFYDIYGTHYFQQHRIYKDDNSFISESVLTLPKEKKD